MREMGMDPAEFNMGSAYDDPELAELDKEMRKRGKFVTTLCLVINKLFLWLTQRVE